MYSINEGGFFIGRYTDETMPDDLRSLAKEAREYGDASATIDGQLVTILADEDMR